MNGRPETQSSYLKVKGQLDDIVEQIRSKDVPLERALDLYEEAIRLGNKCADLIDNTDFSLEEIEAFAASDAGDGGEGDPAAGAEGHTAGGAGETAGGGLVPPRPRAESPISDPDSAPAPAPAPDLDPAPDSSSDSDPDADPDHSR